MAQSAYIHIPFCKSKCKYCSFVSYATDNDEQKKQYVTSLIKEIQHFYKNEPLKTLYLGGGTPSLLNVEEIKKIFKCFNFENNYEATIEINPETVDFDYLKSLDEIGINRISIGIQSFNDKILKNIGRIHSAQKAEEIIVLAQKAGFKNISTDFIYGLPNQTLEDFVSDLKTAINHKVQHISLYGLKIEENCYFYSHLPENLPDDDNQADMYISAIETFERHGYNHYEISNFALESYESKHNLNYWNDAEYYGFGAAAHGYINEKRYANFKDLNTYSTNFKNKEEEITLSTKEQLEETIFLGFRKGTGIDVKKINNKFQIDFEKKYKNILIKYTNSNHLIKTPNGYKLSNEGFLVSNVILSEFL